MKKTFLAFVIASALLAGCTKTNKVKVSVVPSDRTEWIVKLSSPVEAVMQAVEAHYLPDQLIEIFDFKCLGAASDFPVNKLKIGNKLPGSNYNGAGYTYNFAYYKISPDTAVWDGTMDPKDYVYIIDYKNEMLAIWFLDAQTINCKKLDTNIKRSTYVDLPRFKKNVEWKWYFEGNGDANASLAKGKHIESSGHFGYADVTTSFAGGGRFTLPKSKTTIIADGQVVYAE